MSSRKLLTSNVSCSGLVASQWRSLRRVATRILFRRRCDRCVLNLGRSAQVRVRNIVEQRGICCSSSKERFVEVLLGMARLLRLPKALRRREKGLLDRKLRNWLFFRHHLARRVAALKNFGCIELALIWAGGFVFPSAQFDLSVSCSEDKHAKKPRTLKA